ncbi:MAG TPA: hypothetical protein GX529_00850 [Firmicutes bacterium]|nr:hypothetical protein [Candidatus Fermentithermobacillaceae bacterium]
MKRAAKVAPLLLVLILAMVSITGCSQESGEPTIAKMGLGHITGIAKSKDRTEGQDGNVVPPTAQVDTVIAVVAFDKDGKVVKATIDNAQTQVKFDKDLQVVSDLAEKGKTKVELGDEYGMKKNSKIGKEWFEQINEFENWMIGKTVDEIKSLKVKERDPGHPAVPDVPELTSLVTITVQDYIAAVEEAYKNAVEVPEGAIKIGLGTEISIAKSRGYSMNDGKETLPQAQVDTTIAAGVFDKDGKVLHAIIDVAQTQVAYDKDGKVASDKTAQARSKKELGDEYDMVRASKIKKEWHEQIAELEKWMVGKTVAEIKALKVKERDPGHPAVPDVPELTSLVTVTVQDYLAAVDEAYKKSK